MAPEADTNTLEISPYVNKIIITLLLHVFVLFVISSVAIAQSGRSSLAKKNILSHHRHGYKTHSSLPQHSSRQTG